MICIIIQSCFEMQEGVADQGVDGCVRGPPSTLSFRLIEHAVAVSLRKRCNADAWFWRMRWHKTNSLPGLVCIIIRNLHIASDVISKCGKTKLKTPQDGARLAVSIVSFRNLDIKPADGLVSRNLDSSRLDLASKSIQVIIINKLREFELLG